MVHTSVPPLGPLLIVCYAPSYLCMMMRQGIVVPQYENKKGDNSLAQNPIEDARPRISLNVFFFPIPDMGFHGKNYSQAPTDEGRVLILSTQFLQKLFFPKIHPYHEFPLRVENALVYQQAKIMDNY